MTRSVRNSEIRFGRLNSFGESESEIAQSCPTLCDLMDCSLPGSSVHGVFQARVLEWFAISLSRGSSHPRDWTQVSHIVSRHFTVWATREDHSFGSLYVSYAQKVLIWNQCALCFGQIAVFLVVFGLPRMCEIYVCNSPPPDWAAGEKSLCSVNTVPKPRELSLLVKLFQTNTVLTKCSHVQ